MRVDVDVHRHGPIFNGTAPAIVDAGTREAVRDVADFAYNQIHARLPQVLKNPTGYYQSRIRVVGFGTLAQVDDGDVIYGPWLEGVGSRNFPKTRFKGYATFRIVGQLVEQRAEEVADDAIDEAARRL